MLTICVINSVTFTKYRVEVNRQSHAWICAHISASDRDPEICAGIGLKYRPPEQQIVIVTSHISHHKRPNPCPARTEPERFFAKEAAAGSDVH